MRRWNLKLLLLTLVVVSQGWLLSAQEAGIADRIVVTAHGDFLSQRGVVWYTSQEYPGTELEYAPGTDAGPDIKLVKIVKGTADTSRNSPQELVHRVVLSQLKPATRYWYRVGDAGKKAWSTWSSFTMGSGSGAFTFINLTDTQAKDEAENQLSARTIKTARATIPEANFMIHGGDFVEKGGEEKLWKDMINMASDVFSNITLVPVVGNHDATSYAYIDHFNVKPAEGSDITQGAYFSFDYGNTHFVILNTNDKTTEFAKMGPAQIAWMEDDIRKARPKFDWVIVGLHTGPYTISKHGSDADIKVFRNTVALRLMELGVDLVLQGHDHIYARSKPLNGGAAIAVETTQETLNGGDFVWWKKPAGTVFVIPNTAGAKTYTKNFGLGNAYFDLFEVALNARYAGQYGMVQTFAKVHIDGKKLTWVCYEIDPKRFEGQPYILDQFGIDKN